MTRTLETLKFTPDEESSAARPDLHVLESEGNWIPQQLQKLKVLGSGRAAQAVLVEAIDGSGVQKTCVEKIFRPGLLTRFIYRCVYQSAFPYQVSEDAIQACFYRRKVASRLLRAFVPDTAIAEPLYVRWDAESSAYVLGAEFVDGRGIKPAPANLHRFRGWFSSKDSAAQAEPAEIDQLLDVMERTENMLRESGLVGSGWQVCQQAIVSTANLLRTPNGYVVVDLESGIPAMLVAHYVKAGLKIRSLPLFDDVDPGQLRAFLDRERDTLRNLLSESALAELQADAERLIQHSVAWKQSEISLFRQGLPFIGRQFQRQYKSKCLHQWHRTNVTDDETHQRFEQSNRLYSRLTYWAGLIPGTPGRFLQKCCGNRNFRTQVKNVLLNRDCRKAELAQFVQSKSAQMKNAGRIPSEQFLPSFGLAFLVNWCLSKVLPAGTQRWLTDSALRRNHLIRLWLMLVSPRFQREFGQLQIQSAIEKWQTSGRLSPEESLELKQLAVSQEMDEYARCFGLHLSIKLISPLIFTAKVGGVAAFVATGNLMYLLPMAISPLLRTAITVSRMIQNAGRGPAYGEALLVGLVPVVGTLAFPVQLYASSPRLSTFLIRDAVARLSRLIPIYGGKDSRLEIEAIKAADYPLEFIDVSVQMTSAIRKRLKLSDSSDQAEPVSYRMSRWDALAEQQLRLCREQKEVLDSEPTKEYDETAREQRAA